MPRPSAGTRAIVVRQPRLDAAAQSGAQCGRRTKIVRPRGRLHYTGAEFRGSFTRILLKTMI